ncbi:MAG: histidinol-phosphate transaminase [Bacteroidota bacterium]
MIQNRRSWLQTACLSALGLGLSAFDIRPQDPQQLIEDSDIKRLLFNENPYGPSEAAKNQVLQNLYRSHRYCNFHPQDYQALKQLIAQQEGLQPANILLGHGSFEPLSWLAVHFGSNQGQIIVPSPTFDVVGQLAKKIGAEVLPVKVNNNFQIDLETMEAHLSPKTRLLTLCNPNNPTAQLLPKDRLKSFCRRVSEKCPVLIDEAYIQYLDNWRSHTMAPLIAEGKQVLITRTFSKIYGMAGLRIGFLMGSADLITALEKKFTMGFPGNMPNVLSVAAALGALKNQDFLDRSRKRNEQGREQLYRELRRLDLPYVESQANFVYFNVEKFPPFKQLMRDHKIVLAGGWPSHPNWARVTIGKQEEMAYFVDQLEGKRWM